MNTPQWWLAHGDERHTQHPAHHVGADHGHDPGAGGTGQGMVEQGGGQNAPHNGPRALEARGQHEGQQLGLVAHLGEGDDAGGQEEGFQEKTPMAGKKPHDHAASPAHAEATRSKVLPGWKLFAPWPAGQVC